MYVVFLSFNTEDRETGRTLAAYLQAQANLRPWQKQEVKAALLKRAKASHFRIIPVLLPDAPQEPLIPSFLSICMWVDFRGKTLRDDDTLWRLECGIRGESPGCGRPSTIPEQNALPPKLKDSHKQQAHTAQRETPVQQNTVRTETTIAGNVAGPVFSGNFQGTIRINNKS